MSLADDYFSTRGLINRYQIVTGKKVAGAKEVAEAANHETEAQEIFSDFGKKLIEFLSPWIQKFGVEILVIGGNISHAIDLFGPAMELEIQRSKITLQVEVSELKETASIIGSARLLKPEFYSGVKPQLAHM
jgi:glucokinase